MVFVVFNDARDFMEGWGELADNLRARTDAATLGRSGDVDDARQGDFGEEDTMKQTAIKFDDLDRKRVIDAVQEHYGVKLDEVGHRSKWLETNQVEIGGF